jgi:lipooligosaccharide transport system ATP-binding protein
MTSPEEQTHMIFARGLTKVYGEFTAVDGIDFEVRKGEAFGLLGPNGAGKSTTMKMIASVSKRTGGELTILGLDPNKRGPEIRAHLGVVPQQDNLDRELKVHENLFSYGRFFGLSRKFLKGKVEELLEFAQLTEQQGGRALWRYEAPLDHRSRTGQ